MTHRSNVHFTKSDTAVDATAKDSTGATTALTFQGGAVSISSDGVLTATTPVLGVATATSVVASGTVTTGAAAGTNGAVLFKGSTSGTATLTVAVAAGTPTITLPGVTATLATIAGTETLTNKTLTAPVISTISNSGTVTLPTGAETLVGRATTDTLTNKTLTAPTVSGLILSAGSATAASWPVLASGTVLTSAEAGAIERDASVFYLSNANAQRGVLPSLQFVYQSAAFVLQNSTSAQNLFTAASDTFTVRAATTYLFEAYISLTTGATDHITSMSFDAGDCSYTSIAYHSAASSAAADTLASTQEKSVVVATVIAVTATSTAVQTRIRLLGSFQVNAAGTFIPRVTFSADPTGTCQTNIGSYFRVIPIGSNAVVSAGPWA